MPEPVQDLVARIARRDPSRSEATLQADIRSLILTAGLNLTGDQVVDVGVSGVDLEAQVADGTKRRIDIETGATVIEVKRDLTVGTVLDEARVQLGGYVHQRVARTGARYLGVLTDGATWYLYVPAPDSKTELIEAGAPLKVTGAADTEKLTEWLGTVLATVEQVKPQAEKVARALGADSPAHAADHATLAALLRLGRKTPEIRLKRRLWAKLLRAAFGSAFDDDEDLFINHTLLVVIAEIIAHAAIGLDVSKTGPLSAGELVDGTRFASAGIYGVVEADFFDWPIEVPGGADFVRSLAHRLSRFDWTDVKHDVLKHLYESIISADTRKSLGEYYTPDWLADRIVNDAITEPASQRVLDPACGSGTFLFHAVRRHLAAVEAADITPGAAVHSAVGHVYGMDVHPVAVTLARVTYLLALGTSRLLDPDRGDLYIPVFLGDSLQWEQRRDLFDEHGTVTVHTDDHELAEGSGGTLYKDDLVFPAEVTKDATKFDALVREMADAATNVSGTWSKTLIGPIMGRAGVKDATERATLTTTFATMRALHQTGNDHVWSYYVRNLVRPLWLARIENRVDVLVGNPPWLRYSSMTPAMQIRYRGLAQERQLLTGPIGASARDLSTLFVARAVEMYLRVGGSFAFVMPHGVMSRKPHDGFRSGDWTYADVAFTTSWDLGPSAPATGFPMTSCVVRGTRAEQAVRMSNTVERWTVGARRSDQPWSAVADRTVREPAKVYVLDPNNPGAESPYGRKFRSGAILYPRVLFFVTRESAGPLGAGAGRVAVVSRRSDKKPWVQVEPLHGIVETPFVYPVHLGETILPFRAIDPVRAVIPIEPTDQRRMLRLVEIADYPALSVWWRQVEKTWQAHRRTDERADLVDRVDYSRQLSSQFPPGGYRHRVVYTKSGNTIAAARLEGDASIIENKLYWAPANSIDEARYLVGILNSRTMSDAVRPMQNLGLFDTRDIDKLVFRVPFPAYDPHSAEHKALADVVSRCEAVARDIDVSAARTFTRARTLVRAGLAAAGLDVLLEETVARVLPAIDF